jgi:hypothetical protein
MVSRESVCLRRLAGGARSGIVGFGRFLANARVTTDRLIEGWSAATAEASAGRHVLAIQDTSEINFATTPDHRRGLGEIGKGVGRGVLLHAMLGVDAETGGVLGLVAGRVWTREGRVEVPHTERLLSDKESERWLSTAEAAKPVLKPAALVTEVSDRESDIYAKWALVPEPGFHILTRAMHDRRIQGGGKLSSAPLRAAGEAVVELRARPGRAARTARLVAGFARVEVVRPDNTIEEGLPKTVSLSLVQVSEIGPLPGAEPILWRLLTTHPVEDAAMAWRVIDWYRMRSVLPHPQTAGASAGRQPTGERRAARQTDRHRRASRLRHHATRPRPRRTIRTRRRHRLHPRRNRRASSPAAHTGGKNRPAEESPPAPISRLGRLDHRQTRRLGRLSKVQTPRTHHLPTRIPALPVHRPRMGASRCVNRLAAKRGEG